MHLVLNSLGNVDSIFKGPNERLQSLNVEHRLCPKYNMHSSHIVANLADNFIGTKPVGRELEGEEVGSLLTLLPEDKVSRLVGGNGSISSFAFFCDLCL